MNIGQWLLLEERLRKANNIETLQLILVNLLHQVFPHQQAILFARKHHHYKTIAASNISKIDDQSQTVLWLNNKLYPWICEHDKKPSYFALDQLVFDVDQHYLSVAGAVYIPIESEKIGAWGLVCWMDTTADKELIQFLPLIKSCVEHAWDKLANEHRYHHTKKPQKHHIIIGSVVAMMLLFSLLFINVHQTTLAPAQASPESPLLISSSMNGRISSIAVQPNQRVKAGQLLFQLDDISIRNQLEEAEQALNVAKERYLKATHHAFTNEESLHDIKILNEDKELAEATYTYQKSLLARTQVLAPEDGVVLYSSPKDWLGKPVDIGEKIMLLAQPDKKEITFWIPIDNMIHLDKTIPLRFFSNEAPMHATDATIEYINPIAEPTPEGTLAYFGVAKLNNENNIRLGEKGTAKLSGTKVRLGYYLFRRPIRWLRQHLGM